MAWYHRLLNHTRDNTHSREIDQELSFHVTELTDKLIASGMNEADARAEAKRRFGNPTMQKEQTRDSDIFGWLDTVLADVRYALRTFRANPLFTFIVVLSLGLGIGANSAIFTMVNAVVLKTLPVPHPEQLKQFTMGKDETDFTNPLWEAIRDRQDSFSGAFAYSSNTFDLSTGGEARNVSGNWVSGDFFNTLGLAPAAGRMIRRDDDKPGCTPVAVIGNRFWQSEYGGAASAVGKTISLNGHAFEVIGVADPSFAGLEVGQSAQIFAPLCALPLLEGADVLANRSRWYLQIAGRIKDGVTVEAANAKLAAIAPSVFASTLPTYWSQEVQDSYLKHTLVVTDGAAGLSDLRSAYSKALYILMAIVGIVLLISCANVANLLLARATVRQREMAIRLAIGASRARLIRQLLTESLMLALGGAIAGIVFAQWGSRLLVGMLTTRTNGVWLDLSVDARVLAFTVGVAVITGVLFGLAPAFRAVRVDPQSAMKAGGRGTTGGRSRLTIAKTLVVSQVALSLVLVMGAALLVGTFRRLANVDPGFKPQGVLLTSMDIRTSNFSPEQQAAAERQVLERLRTIPGVRAAATSMITPISGAGWNGDVAAEGFVPKDQRDGMAFFNAVSEGYFSTMNSTLVAGRDFGPGDVKGAPKVSVINETMAHRFFGDRNPVGLIFRVSNGRAKEDPYIVIGVVKDAKYRSLSEKTPPTAFFQAAQQDAESSINYEIRGDGDPALLIPAVKSAISNINPAFSLQFTSLSDQISASLRRPRLLATLSGFFGGLALLLAVIGLYGIISYSVARRRTEIGVRIALGAGSNAVVRMVLSEVVTVVIIGSIAGAAISYYATGLVKTFLFGVTATDPKTFVYSAALLAVVAITAGAIPALRASRLNPMLALREE